MRSTAKCFVSFSFPILRLSKLRIVEGIVRNQPVGRNQLVGNSFAAPVVADSNRLAVVADMQRQGTQVVGKDLGTPGKPQLGVEN